ncbi:zinc-finger domain-containing protein [Bacillus changyiensis]|uniref:zinc-finger domain-containing protein n=1 Tax=Bacillus changyiensis TaxID=3004103 RepID=UPI0022E926EE|nr:zinc-finger domain-containing protein [Bacillus changyiensis]MDA1475403.1 zinc-finger domain-containing protein [Bacillus changyiensis]
MDKKEIFKELTDLQDSYCEGCFIKKHFRKEHGKTYAHTFCITKCTVGEKLRTFGEVLMNKN